MNGVAPKLLRPSVVGLELTVLSRNSTVAAAWSGSDATWRRQGVAAARSDGGAKSRWRGMAMARNGGGSGWRWASTIFKASSAAKRLIRDAAGAVQDVMAGAMGSMQRKRGAAEMTEEAAEQGRQVRPRTGDG